MSVTGTYALWLGKDRSPKELSEGTAALVAAIDAANWVEPPTKKLLVNGITVYYWSAVYGPWLWNADGTKPEWPLEKLIESVVECHEGMENDFSLFVWVEGEFQSVTGHFHRYNMLRTVPTIVFEVERETSACTTESVDMFRYFGEIGMADHFSDLTGN